MHYATDVFAAWGALCAVRWSLRKLLMATANKKILKQIKSPSTGSRADEIARPSSYTYTIPTERPHR